MVPAPSVANVRDVAAKFAMATLFEVSVTARGLFVPVTSPDQPLKKAPGPGRAVSTTILLGGYPVASRSRRMVPLPLVIVVKLN